MKIQDMYRNFSYKVRLKLVDNGEELRKVIFDQLPYLLTNNKIKELKEITGIIDESRSYYYFPTQLREDFNSAVLIHAIENDKKEIFEEFKDKSILLHTVIPVLLESKKSEFINFFCTLPEARDNIANKYLNMAINAANNKNFDKLTDVFTELKAIEKHMDLGSKSIKLDRNALNSKVIWDLKNYDTTIMLSNSNIIELISEKLVNRTNLESLPEVIEYLTNNIDSCRLNNDGISRLIDKDEANLLKSLIINPKVTIDLNAKDVNSGLLNPEIMLVKASRVGAINTMKLAVELNGQTPSVETLEKSLRWCVAQNDKVGINYLVTTFKDHYKKEYLNEISKDLLLYNRIDTVVYLKEKSPLIDVEVPVEKIIENKPRKLDHKITRLRENAFTNGTSRENDLTI